MLAGNVDLGINIFNIIFQLYQERKVSILASTLNLFTLFKIKASPQVISRM